jgi:hypothetical protein
MPLLLLLLLLVVVVVPFICHAIICIQMLPRNTLSPHLLPVTSAIEAHGRIIMHLNQVRVQPCSSPSITQNLLCRMEALCDADVACMQYWRVLCV